MKTVSRLAMSVLLAGILLFCIFGFRATFEPMEHSTQLAFRWMYGVGGVVILGGLFYVNRPGRGKGRTE